MFFELRGLRHVLSPPLTSPVSASAVCARAWKSPERHLGTAEQTHPADVEKNYRASLGIKGRTSGRLPDDVSETLVRLQEDQRRKDDGRQAADKLLRARVKMEG